MSSKDKGLLISENVAALMRNVSKIHRVEAADKSGKASDVVSVKRVNLVVEIGDSIGLLGQNGSGKSSLLRILAGTESQTEGDVFVRSKPTLLGVGAALVPQLSGVKNIELGCLAMGIEPAKIPEITEEIKDFAEIGDAIYRPMVTYSSGMSARLRFAIGTAAPADLLLVDEALSTGDAGFAAKAAERMHQFLENSGTLFLVSHAAQDVERNCTRGIWMHYGEIIADGSAEEVSARYKAWTNLRSRGDTRSANLLITETAMTYRAPSIWFDSEVERLL